MNEIDVSFQDSVEDVPLKDKITMFLDRVLGYLRLDNWQVSVVLCSDDFIRELNRNYRHLDFPTDVLSFPQDITLEDGKKLAGDIIISLNYVRNSAKKYKIMLNEELKRVLVHGILHLHGLDHEETDNPMLVLQEEILKFFNKETLL